MVNLTQKLFKYIFYRGTWAVSMWYFYCSFYFSCSKQRYHLCRYFIFYEGRWLWLSNQWKFMCNASQSPIKCDHKLGFISFMPWCGITLMVTDLGLWYMLVTEEKPDNGIKRNSSLGWLAWPPYTCYSPWLLLANWGIRLPLTVLAVSEPAVGASVAANGVNIVNGIKESINVIPC